jgi:hypothetical protein
VAEPPLHVIVGVDTAVTEKGVVLKVKDAVATLIQVPLEPVTVYTVEAEGGVAKTLLPVDALSPVTGAQE